MKRKKAFKIAAIITLAIMFLLFAGCNNKCAQQLQTEKEYVYLYAPIADSLQGYGDTVVRFQKVIERDTVLKVEYYPDTKTIRIRAPTDTIRIHQPADTVERQILVKPPLTEKLGLVFIGVIITGVFAAFGYFIYKKKTGES
jgi:hypothetical protein